MNIIATYGMGMLVILAAENLTIMEGMGSAVPTKPLLIKIILKIYLNNKARRTRRALKNLNPEILHKICNVAGVNRSDYDFKIKSRRLDFVFKFTLHVRQKPRNNYFAVFDF